MGKTVRTLDVRWEGHTGSARREDTDTLICRAIAKHGPENFSREVIEECDESILSARETFWIHEKKTHVTEGGYNLTYGGDGGLPGYRFSEESKEKIRQKALGRVHSPEILEKIGKKLRGKKWSDEAIAKRAEGNRGKKRTPEQKARIRAAQLARGYRHSEETRTKIGEKSKNRIVSEETRAKIGLLSRGRKKSDYAKQQVRLARSKPVSQFDRNGVLIGEFPSIKVATEQTKISRITIQRSVALNLTEVIRISRRAEYFWRYKNVKNTIKDGA